MFFSFRYAVLIGSRFRFLDINFIHVRSPSRDAPDVSLVGEDAPGDRAGWSHHFWIVVLLCNHRSSVDILVSPRKTRSCSPDGANSFFSFYICCEKSCRCILYYNVCLCFFFFAYLDWVFILDWIHRLTAARSSGVAATACAWLTGFVIVYTVNSELKRNSIRWYADRY